MDNILRINLLMPPQNLLAKTPALRENHPGLWPPLQKTEGNVQLSILTNTGDK